MSPAPAVISSDTLQSLSQSRSQDNGIYFQIGKYPTAFVKIFLPIVPKKVWGRM